MSEWKEKPLDELTMLIKDGTHGTHKDVANGIPLLSAKDINHGKFYIKDDCRRISLEDYNAIHATYEFGLGDILLTVVGTIGRVAIISDIAEKITFQRSVAIIRFNSKIFPRFAFYQISSDKFISLLERSMNASAQGGVYLGELAKIKICYPHHPHQRKIARILTTVDNIIEKNESAIEKYKAIKQGMMHDLFTRGIDFKTGRLRPSYEDAPELYKETELGMIPKEWKDGCVEMFCEVHNHLRQPISTEVRVNMKGIYPYYGCTGILDFIDEYRVDGKFVLIGEDGDHFLKFDQQKMTLLIDGKFNVNNHAHILKGKKDCLTEWIHTYFAHRDITLFLTRQGAGRFKLNKDALLNLPMSLPRKGEQKKIIEKFFSIERKIESERTFLDKTFFLKQALMQDLLTGKKEVIPDPEDFDNEHLATINER